MHCDLMPDKGWKKKMFMEDFLKVPQSISPILLDLSLD